MPKLAVCFEDVFLSELEQAEEENTGAPSARTHSRNPEKSFTKSIAMCTDLGFGPAVVEMLLQRLIRNPDSPDIIRN